jgi:hypothetical protein
MAATQNLLSDNAAHWAFLQDLVQRLETLEANSVSLAAENASLRERVSVLEQQGAALRKNCEDLSLKVEVLRQPRLSTAAQRAFGTFELLEQILELCPTKQLFRLQRVSKQFCQVVGRSPPLQSRIYQNPKDVVSSDVKLDEWTHLWPMLRLNRFFKEPWQRHPSRVSIALNTGSSTHDQIGFRITDQLTATFEYRITTAADTSAALKTMTTSLGRAYLTQPALPTSVWVSFLDTSILRDRNEYLRAARSPTSLPPNVTAQAQIRAATVLQMLQVADALYRYHHAKWSWDAAREAWLPNGAEQKINDLPSLSLIIEKPVYSGWRTVQPKSGRIVFDT